MSSAIPHQAPSIFFARRGYRFLKRGDAVRIEDLERDWPIIYQGAIPCAVRAVSALKGMRIGGWADEGSFGHIRARDFFDDLRRWAVLRINIYRISPNNDGAIVGWSFIRTSRRPLDPRLIASVSAIAPYRMIGR